MTVLRLTSTWRSVFQAVPEDSGKEMECGYPGIKGGYHMRIGQRAAERVPERILEERRGLAGKRLRRLERSKGMQVFLWITLAVLLLYAVFAFLYTTAIVYASGRATSFLWFWPLTLLIALVAAAGLFLVLTGRLECLRRAAVCLSLVFWLCLVVFFSWEAVIFSAGRRAPQADASYVIILGAQVRGEAPTLVLDARINAAAEYLLKHPEAVAVASGGQGSGESISEAEAIKRGLMRRGIAEERILTEERSTSTMENLKFSADVIAAYETAAAASSGGMPEGAAGLPGKVVLVTNDFHVYRATRLAGKMGYGQVSGLGATEFFAVTIQYYVREFFAIIMESLRGNL